MIPDLIEIIPPSSPIQAEVTVPGSKSLTNRALILAALAEGEVTLRGALWSEDTQVMTECLERVGVKITVLPDDAELCNRTIVVQGCAGDIPRGGTRTSPLELFVGNAGTAARFLTAFLCLGQGSYRLHGVARMHERPQAALFDALRQLGYSIDSPSDRLPALIQGAGRRPGACWVKVTESSQFASALMLCSRRGGWDVHVVGENEEESPYVALTAKLIASFPHHGGTFQIEPDASSGSYFWAAGEEEVEEWSERTSSTGEVRQTWVLSRPSVRVGHWPDSGWQIDQQFPRIFERIKFGSPFFQKESAALTRPRNGSWHSSVQDLFKQAPSLLPPGASGKDEASWFGAGRAGRRISRRTDLGDSIMTAIVLAPLAILPLEFSELGRLRLQECERVSALRTELTKCGSKVIEEGDTLTVHPSSLHGAEIDTYQDHRMAMCFAILGLKVPGIKIKNPACVKKTFPNFFQKLAAAPPVGLGVKIIDATNRARLNGPSLFAG